MTDKKKVIKKLKEALDSLDITSNLRLILIQTIEYLQEEPVSEPIDFEKELYKAFGQVKDFTLCMRIAKRFYDMGKNSHEPVSEELEEAANNALNNVLNTHEIVNVGSCIEMFKFGAEWKEKEMRSTIELAEDHAMLAGMNKMKERMMAKAVDAKIGSFTNGIIYDADFDINSNLKDNDKVKVIVIKED